MAWTTPETFTAGQTLTAASMNAISENVDYLREGRPSAVTPMCRVKRSGDLTWTNPSEIAWNAEDIDTNGMHDNSTNSQRITLNVAGLYVVTLNAFITYSSNLSGFEVMIRKNGSNAGMQSVFGISQGTSARFALTAQVESDGDDYVTAYLSLFGTTGTHLVKDDATSYFSAVWVGQKP